MNTIFLQLVGEYIYPVNQQSRETLEEEFRISRILEERFDMLAPKLIRKGYKMAVANYTPKVYKDNRKTFVGAGSGEPVKNPCVDCYLRELCDADDCGRKHFRINTNKEF